MDATLKYGDLVRYDMKQPDGSFAKIVGCFYEMHGKNGDNCLVDFKMKDSTEWSTVLNVCEMDRIEKLTDQEYFLWRLSGRGTGYYDED